MKGTAIIIVAAGSSSRMKSPKQLLPLGDSTLLGKVIAQAKATTANEVFTVLGANYEAVKSSIENYSTTVVENKNWKHGLGSSIAAGVQYVLENRDLEAVMILLGDQPLIEVKYIDELLASFHENPSVITATKYPHSNGVPAVFPKKYFKHLAELNDDYGAKSLLNGSTQVLVLDPGEKTIDVDTLEDYRYIQKEKAEIAIRPEEYFFEDDGRIPNSKLPLLIYKNVFVERGEEGANWLEERFSENNWSNSWRNGIYDYHHYHSITHEVLGIYSGKALLHLGGEEGKKIEVTAGDIIVIPAGIGHKNLGSQNFSLVGAYPNGSKYDMNYGKEEERPEVDKNIAALAIPGKDPLLGKHGGVSKIWGEFKGN